MKRFRSVFAAFVLLFTIVTTASAQSVSVTPRPTARTGGCKAVESVVKRRTEALPKLAENQMNKFASHVTRVDTYYTSTLVPAGNIVSNYSELMTQITIKKTAVATAITQARADGAAFTCESNPKGTMTTFRKDMQAVITALKEYKTSVRNLIVAVATAVSDTQGVQ